MESGSGLSDGIDFGGQSNNDSLTFVDDDALSGFAYDYEDETTSGPNKTEEAGKMNSGTKNVGYSMSQHPGEFLVLIFRS